MNSVCSLHIYVSTRDGGEVTSSPQPEDSGQLLHLGNLSTVLQHLAIKQNLFSKRSFPSDERHNGVTATEELLGLLMWEGPALSTSGWKR